MVIEMDYFHNYTSRSLLKDFGKFLYIVSPEESSFEEIKDVPNYFTEIFPLFLGLVCAEYVALAMKGEAPRLAESLNSIAHGIISETIKVLLLGVEVCLYVSIHNKYRFFDLPWDNPLTWYIALLGVDMAYYWAHRASHEVNFLWAQHSVHHSSEDFNMAVAVRHPVSQNWINSFFYLPLALVIPPTHCLAHQQLNLLYQGWIHTSLVGNLGPLEYILNTPTHHKVHHGCNLYVLDKNFGGLLIIWDRIFGTFQAMKKDEQLVFGIVFQHKSFNPYYQMWHKWPALWQWAKSQASWADSLRSVCYGPSWVPGAPRVGRDSDKVDIKPRPKFEVPLEKWLQAYILIHFVAVCLVFQEFALKKGSFDEMTVLLTVAYILITLTSIGFLSEGNPWGSYFEFIRCLGFLYICDGEEYFLNGALQFYFLPSLLIWGYFIVQQLLMRSTSEIAAIICK